jgi:hypothetical protein
LPFTVAVNANDGGNLAAVRMGAEVPVKATTFASSSEKPSPEGKPAPAPITSYSYRSIGTNLRDGETTQFTAATDRINGEVVRVEVTLNVVK